MRSETPAFSSAPALVALPGTLPPRAPASRNHSSLAAFRDPRCARFCWLRKRSATAVPLRSVRGVAAATVRWSHRERLRVRLECELGAGAPDRVLRLQGGDALTRGRRRA